MPMFDVELSASMQRVVCVQTVSAESREEAVEIAKRDALDWELPSWKSIAPYEMEVESVHVLCGGE